MLAIQFNMQGIYIQLYILYNYYIYNLYIDTLYIELYCKHIRTHTYISHVSRSHRMPLVPGLW